MSNSLDDVQEDLTFVHARREFRLVRIVVVCLLMWIGGVCMGDGFSKEGNSIPLLFGMPRWAVLGVLTPWCFALAFNYWFGLFYVADDDLQKDDPAED